MTSETGTPVRARGPYYFMLTFWGQRYCEYFYSLLLPTLLSPGNLPVLKDRPGSKLVIATTPEDWSRIMDRPLVAKLAEFVDPLILNIDPPGPNDYPQLHMSKGHRIAAKRAREDGAVAGFLAPDLLCADGLIAKAVGLIEGGKKVVLCPALRFAMEPVLERLNAENLLRPGEPIRLPPSLLGSIAAESLHPEILRYDFESSHFDNYPIWTFWRVPGRHGLVIYTVSWALLLGDYSAIPTYRDNELEHSTIDGTYVSHNFGHLLGSDAIGTLDDSADGIFMSLTPKDALDFRNYRPASNAIVDRIGLREYRRLCEINTLHHSMEIDPWRRWLHCKPFVIHGDERDATYEREVERTRALMIGATRSPIPLLSNGRGESGEIRISEASSKTLRFARDIWRVSGLPPAFVIRCAYWIIRLFRAVDLPVHIVIGVYRGRYSVTRLLRRALHHATLGLLQYPRTTPNLGRSESGGPPASR